MKLTIEEREYDIDDATVALMSRLVEKTTKDGREYGFTLCQSESGGITAGKVCSGKECVILRGCGDDRREAGSFHTHTIEEPLGFDDYSNFLRHSVMIKREHGLECLGTARGGVRCVSQRDLPPYFILGVKLEDLVLGENDEERQLVRALFSEEVSL